MRQCQYLMELNSTFCRLKGIENPRCKGCSLWGYKMVKPSPRLVAGRRFRAF